MEKITLNELYEDFGKKCPEGIEGRLVTLLDSLNNTQKESEKDKIWGEIVIIMGEPIDNEEEYSFAKTTLRYEHSRIYGDKYRYIISKNND